MPQDQKPWERYGAQTAQPQGQYPGVIQGRPAPVDPVEERRDQIGLSREEIGLRRDQIQLERLQAETAANELEQKLGKEAGFYLRARQAGDAFDTLGVGPESQMRAAAGAVLPDNWLNQLTPSARQEAEAWQRNFVMAALRYESGAAIPQEEIDSAIQTYFPVAGDGEATIQAKARMRRDLVESLRLGAGPEASRQIDQYVASLGDETARPAATAGDGGGATVPIANAQGRQYYDENGNPVGSDYVGQVYYEDGTEGPFRGRVTDTSPDEAVQSRANTLDRKFGELGKGDLMNHGATLGMSDELAGIGAAIGGALRGDLDVSGNYQLGRDAEQLRIDQAREREGGMGLAAEVAGGIPVVLGKAGQVMRAGRAAAAANGGRVTREGVRSAMTRQATKDGAVAGAVGGFGYGEGVEGSATNALLGAGGGALLGNASQRVGNSLASRAAGTTQRGEQATALTQAADRVGMQGAVNRAMVDPRSNNAVTRADGSLMGGPTVQREMGRVADRFETAVGENLGAGGRVLDDVARGDTARNAAERWIRETGEIASRRYDRAERMAGDARIEATQATTEAQNILRRLQETPETNKEEIAAVQRLVRDLAGEGEGLSVGALRRMRTSLRKRISRGDLVFGEDEANVLAIMDAAADDITRGLQQQGKGAAAEAFRTADASYRARSEFIKNTVQKLIGGRNSNLNAGQVARKINSLERSDYRELRKVYSMLNPEERLDMAATMAQRLGRNSTDNVQNAEFSLDTFLTNTSKLDKGAIEAVFGLDGARAMEDLRKIGEQVRRVRSSFNSRTSKTGIVDGFREYIYTALVSGGAGFAGGGAGTAIGLGTLAVAGNAIRQSVNAKLLMSPKFTRWLRQAPNTSNPRAIDAHFTRLGEIASSEPALAASIERFRSNLLGAVNDNTAAVPNVAAEEDQEQ